jgi:hypothetical protein
MSENIKANNPKSFLLRTVQNVTRNSTFCRVQLLKLSRLFPLKTVISWRYRLVTGHFPDLENPRKFTEKVQWYKLNYHDPRMTQCADKYCVRQYVEKKGLANILNDLYFVCDNVEDINFSELPNEFVLKTTNASSTNIFCRDKSKLNIDNVKKQVKLFMDKGTIDIAGEWAYTNIKNRIIVERFRSDPTTVDGSLNDCKFFCFNGKMEFFVIDSGRFSLHCRNFYNRNGVLLDVCSDRPVNNDGSVRVPDNLDEMVAIAERLASVFPFVRVDLYNIAGEVMFGEMTFYPWSGNVRFSPESFDYEIGNKFMLPAPVK